LGAPRLAQKVGAVARGQIENGRETRRELARRAALVRLQLADGVDGAAGAHGELSLT
jgi:hypothetical protein